jgi:hypothetical protein
MPAAIGAALPGHGERGARDAAAAAQPAAQPSGRSAWRAPGVLSELAAIYAVNPDR